MLLARKARGTIRKSARRICRVLLFLAIVYLQAPDGAGSVNVIRLKGSGASFPSTVYDLWIPLYSAARARHVSLDMKYASVGSGKGKEAISRANPSIEYAGSDSLLSNASYAAFPDLQMFPVLAGAVVLAYNIPELKESGRSLVLSGEQIAGIYNGTYEWWNDTTFRSTNDLIAFPRRKVVKLARADGSGTTAIFTSALSAFSPEWNAAFGSFSKGSSNWDPNVIDFFGQTTKGMVGLLMSLPYSVGYMSISDALENNLSYCHVVNSVGNVIAPTDNAIQKAMDDYAERFTERFTLSIVNAPGPQSYPIAGYTYFIIRMRTMKNCESASELLRYITWIFNDKRAVFPAKQHHMVSLSQTIKNRIVDKVLKRVSCNGKNVWKLMQEQKHKEYLSEQKWQIGVGIALPVLICLVIIGIAYQVYQRVKSYKNLNNDNWHINIEDIVFFQSDKRIHRSHLRFHGDTASFLTESDTIGSIADVSTVIQWPGKWDSYTVGIRLLAIENMSVVYINTKKLLMWFKEHLSHSNLLKFYGLTLIDNERYIVSEYCAKGPLNDLLQNEKFNITKEIKMSLTADIAEGLQFLHSREIVHGRLRSSCCLVDSRWTVKIADWELYRLYTAISDDERPLLHFQPKEEHDGKHAVAFADFWTAPEILRSDYTIQPTSSCDIYSFGIIMQEVFTRQDPYSEHSDNLDPTQLLVCIKSNGLRPSHAEDTPLGMRQIMEISWAEDSARRPSARDLVRMLKLSNTSKRGILDRIIESMEENNDQMELRLQHQTSELVALRTKVNRILETLAPTEVVRRLASGRHFHPKVVSPVSALCLQVDLTPKSSVSDNPQTVISALAEIQTFLDDLATKYCAFNMNASSGNFVLISRQAKKKYHEDKHARVMAKIGTEAIKALSSMDFEICPESEAKLKCAVKGAIHSGSVVIGVNGTDCPRYCVYGDVVHYGWSMLGTSAAGKIKISETTKEFLSSSLKYEYTIADCISMEVDGEEKSLQTYWMSLVASQKEALSSVVTVPSQETNDDTLDYIAPLDSVLTCSDIITPVDI